MLVAEGVLGRGIFPRFNFPDESLNRRADTAASLKEVLSEASALAWRNIEDVVENEYLSRQMRTGSDADCGRC